MRGGVIGWVGREHPVPGGPAAGSSGTQRLSASEGPHSSLPLLSPLPPCPPHLQLPLHQQKVLALIDTPPRPSPHPRNRPHCSYLQLPLHQHKILTLIDALHLGLEHHAVLLARLDPALAVAVEEHVPAEGEGGEGVD